MKSATNISVVYWDRRSPRQLFAKEAASETSARAEADRLIAIGFEATVDVEHAGCADTLPGAAGEKFRCARETGHRGHHRAGAIEWAS